MSVDLCMKTPLEVRGIEALSRNNINITIFHGPDKVEKRTNTNVHYLLA